jgi:4'-phosphopantetheinyl transferase
MGGGPPMLQITTMCLDRLDEAAVAVWLPWLDTGERQRAARFAFARHRVQFIAAHALLRAVLGRMCDAPPTAWRFVADVRGKPSAWLAQSPAPVSFNLSHADGIVGVAAGTGADRAIGFDLEPLARQVDLGVAGHFFSPREAAWLAAQPAAAQAESFLRLWTLKEAFLKATGKGLTQDLASFSFDPLPPRIEFAEELAESPADWWFEQRLLEGRFVAAVALRRPAGTPVGARWLELRPGDLRRDQKSG